jgi:hypothetical protein
LRERRRAGRGAPLAGRAHRHGDGHRNEQEDEDDDPGDKPHVHGCARAAAPAAVVLAALGESVVRTPAVFRMLRAPSMVDADADHWRARASDVPEVTAHSANCPSGPSRWLWSTCPITVAALPSSTPWTW